MKNRRSIPLLTLVAPLLALVLYYGQPGPFNEDVEQTVFSGVRSVLARVGRSTGR